MIFTGLILCFALRTAFGNTSGVKRCGDADDDVGSEQLTAEVGLKPDTILDFSLANFIHYGVHLEW
ncbi:hypothetical protein RRF57_008578 [Xylaria bambusicola]|uniref:Uncharacterized protein n=1 Tax=Xylaria bambusicola TaxID=326684 RepID=A0AAN7UY89_9PEZI